MTTKLEAAAQTIVNRLNSVESGETRGAGGYYHCDSKHWKDPEKLSGVVVPAALLRDLRNALIEVKEA